MAQTRWQVKASSWHTHSCDVLEHSLCIRQVDEDRGRVLYVQNSDKEVGRNCLQAIPVLVSQGENN